MNKLLLLLCIFSLTSCWYPEEYKWAGKTMGTTYHVTFINDKIPTKKFAKIIKEIDAKLVEVNKQMSTYDPESEISKFNTYKSVGPFNISDEFAEVILVSKAVFGSSQGAFDPTVMPYVNLWGFGPGAEKSVINQSDLDQFSDIVGFEKVTLKGNSLIKSHKDVTIDLSAVAKGHGVDIIAKLFESYKVDNYLIEIGGEIRTKGKREGKKWTIGIETPGEGLAPGESINKVLYLSDAALATSGDYRNFKMKNDKRVSHTIDPRTGWPISHNLASVTVIAKTTALADAYATAVMTLGKKDGLKLIESLKNTEAMFITRKMDGSFKESYSKGFLKYTIK